MSDSRKAALGNTLQEVIHLVHVSHVKAGTGAEMNDVRNVSNRRLRTYLVPPRQLFFCLLAAHVHVVKCVL